MSQTVVVVTFYSRGGATERTATAAAVGAVQARAGIRMRRLPDPDPSAALARFPAQRDSLQRMHKEYVAPREADVIAAHVLVLASPSDVSAGSPEWAPFLALLTDLHAQGKLRGKIGVVAADDASGSLQALVERLGLTTVPAVSGTDDVARATALGRAAVAAAQSARPPA